MKVALFSARPDELEAFARQNANRHELTFFPQSLTPQTAGWVRQHEAVSCFVHDRINDETLSLLAGQGVRLLAIRAAGYNHVDVAAAHRHGISLIYVPDYPPSAVAEYAVGLLLALVRSISTAHRRVRDFNFLIDELIGRDLRGQTVGVIGTGRIGSQFGRIMNGFGCRVLGYDLAPSLSNFGVITYVDKTEILRSSDILSLHLPLTLATRRFIDAPALALMRPGSVLINTARGGLIDSEALLQALDSGLLAGAALDVYENENDVFYKDLSRKGLRDRTLISLIAHPNVLLTAHQAFFTKEATENIVATTLAGLDAFAHAEKLVNAVPFPTAPSAADAGAERQIVCGHP